MPHLVYNRGLEKFRRYTSEVLKNHQDYDQTIFGIMEATYLLDSTKLATELAEQRPTKTFSAETFVDVDWH